MGNLLDVFQDCELVYKSWGGLSSLKKYYRGRWKMAAIPMNISAQDKALNQQTNWE